MDYRYDVFISASRRDYAVVDRIVSALNSGGFTYIKDGQGFDTGLDFLQSIINAIYNSKLFLCILSQNSYSSEFVIKELEYALNKTDGVVLPVVVDNSQLPDRLKNLLGTIHIVNWQFSGSLNIEGTIIRDISCALGRNEENFSKEILPSSIAKREVNNRTYLSATIPIPEEINLDASFRIFISYKRVDEKKVFPLKDIIEKNTGVKCWIDLDGIESDAQFANVIIKAINNAPIFLFMYSHAHSEIEDYDTDWTVREINFAQKKRKRIVFVNIDGSPLTDWFELMFGTKQQIDASSNIRMEKLCKDLTRWLK
ncbi:MAG: toll/interleukin-1 receptor domain-containing protein [Bacteroidaceae bacterium]|nr:toll/interleukin-1 receptor domain-containing protein [Bacteroidaceae bacterium]